MSANLDKALDEIIDSNKKHARKANKAGPRKMSKNIRRKGPISSSARKPMISLEKASSILDAAYATKVNVEGLPRDIKEDAVRDFFRSSVGGLQRVLLSYNERGNSTGMATLTFANAEKAREAVKKFNGAPIDGGKSKLRLNLIVDPTRKPLSARIAPVNKGKDRVLRPVPRRDAPRKEATRRDSRAPNKKTAMAKAEKRRSKPQKKSLEQLDQEMTDYFEDSNK
ncbi:HEL018Wp [Eremothecium sinecaudum]|uniref:HEL018Wp n=1 Tax=Eremothecium sinecaudum TaxID=45286 RepID=A0A0X8HTK0_9SACH|nr:HEL018Wp [Eremothecium sinecaudum]AMD21262.1 HEL018Wp [Eremothecium sinecaudum]